MQRMFTALQNAVNDVAVYYNGDNKDIRDVSMCQHNTHHKSHKYYASLRFKENLPTSYEAKYSHDTCSYTNFNHSAVCLTTSLQLLAQPVLQRVRSSVSFFGLQYPLVSARSFSTCLRLLPRLPAIAIIHYIFPSVTCFPRQFLRKM